MNKEKMTLCTPWYEFYNEVNAFFKEDKDVHVELVEHPYVLKVYVDDSEKADALAVILPEEKILGNIHVKIEVIPADGNLKGNFGYDLDAYRRAFKGNGAVVDFQHVEAFGWVFDYIMCKPAVVQLENDSMKNPWGLVSTLYENLADDIFIPHPGLFFTTYQLPTGKKEEPARKVKFPKDEM